MSKYVCINLTKDTVESVDTPMSADEEEEEQLPISEKRDDEASKRFAGDHGAARSCFLGGDQKPLYCTVCIL